MFGILEIDTDTQTEESPEGSPEPVQIMGARRRGDTLNSVGRRESLTRQPSVTPTGTLYDEESDLINGNEVQATLDRQSKEIQKLKMQIMHLRRGAQQVEERPSPPPEKGGKSPKEVCSHNKFPSNTSGDNTINPPPFSGFLELRRGGGLREL